MANKVASPVLAALLAVLGAACSQSDSDPPAPGTVATDPPAAALDCDSVPFHDAAAIQTPLTNWRLAYGRMCPALAGALTDCPQLIGATDDDILRCLRQNLDADDECPDAMRDTLRDAVEASQIATRCRTLHAELVVSAIQGAVAEYGELPPATIDRAAGRCQRQNPFDPDEARICVATLLQDARLERDRQQELAAAREQALAAIQQAIDAATPALPPETAEILRTRCMRSAGDTPSASDCAESGVEAHRAQHQALEALPADQRDHVVRLCLRNNLAADRSLGLAHPDCIAEDARAFAVLTADYPEEYPECRPNRNRFSALLDCARRRWLTHDRIVAAKNRAVDEMIPTIQPRFLRPAVASHCRRGAKDARRLLRYDSFRPDEHATRIVYRDVSTCVDEEMSAYREIARLAGTSYAKTFESCTAADYVDLHGWRMVAKCLHEAADDAGDAPFADALEPCLGAVNVSQRYKYVDDLANCPNVPER